MLVLIAVHAPGNRLGDRKTTYFFPPTVGQCMATFWPAGTGSLGFKLGKSFGALGSTPARYFCQLLTPSPDGQALEAESRLFKVPNQRRRHESGMPSP